MDACLYESRKKQTGRDSCKTSYGIEGCKEKKFAAKRNCHPTDRN